MNVSVIIRTYNESRWILKCIQSIKNQNFSGSYEIIIIDNESTDNTVKIAKNQGCSVINISRNNFSYGRAINLGCKFAKGKYLVIVSAHCIPTSKFWLRSLISNFKSNVVAVYGPQFPHNEASSYQKRRMSFYVGNDKIIHQNLPIFFSNSNAAILKSVWIKNKFDEKVSFREDKIWAKKMLSMKKLIVYEPSAGVYHYHDFSIIQWFIRAIDVGKAPVIDKESFFVEIHFIKNFFSETYMDFKYNTSVRNKIYMLFLSPIYNSVWLFGSLIGRVYYRLIK